MLFPDSGVMIGGCQAYATHACVMTSNAGLSDTCITVVYSALGSNASGEASLWAGVTSLLSLGLLCHVVLLATTTYAVRRPRYFHFGVIVTITIP